MRKTHLELNFIQNPYFDKKTEYGKESKPRAECFEAYDRSVEFIPVRM